MIEYDRMAELYDSFVQFDADIPFFLDECRRARGPVLEMMSGTGRVSLPLVRAGFEVTCVDRSAGMLNVLARKLEGENLTATLLEQDVRDLSLPGRYPLAFIPFNSFSELVTETDQLSALRSIRRWIAPGGRFICTLHNPVVRLRTVNPEPATVARFAEPGGGGEIILRIESALDEKSAVVRGLQTFEFLGPDGQPTGRRTVEIEFALPDRASFENLARAGGFEIEALHGDYDRSAFVPAQSPYMILSLRPGP